MEKLFNVILQNRKAFHEIIKETPKEQLLHIPEGFRNNIWWNIAHAVVTQQVLLYKFSGVPMKIDEELVTKFRKGTVPDGTADDDEIEKITDLIVTSVEWAQKDYKNGVFKAYNEYTTSAKVTLSNVEDAIAFVAFHEGLHRGAVIALQKMVMLKEA
ncbi:DinB family protein [Kriegella aquimaris]|uniref:DinB superfamily protein n=1 Tax=Kriegella aquimaris TaxID=192904 RepID=A0A1G9LVS9_9FLAO|nr:DinB family protein [Kriegella aquimaris]SDL65545.1 DinB superfamily protein [Kriegella aquimaris]